MSKSAMIMMIALLVAFGAMLLAADLIVGPIEKDLGAARAMIDVLDARGWLTEDKPRPDDRVRVRSLKGGGEGRMSQGSDWGVIVEVRPSKESLATKGRLASLAQTVVDQVEEYGRTDKLLHWIELVMKSDRKDVLRTLIERDPRGGWRPAEPPIPATWPPESKK